MVSLPSPVRGFFARPPGAKPGGRTVALLNKRASLWYEENGLFTEAITHTLAAKSYERVGYLILEAMPDIISRNEIYTFLRWIDALPPVISQTFPEFSMACAWLLLANSQLNRSDEYLEYTEKALGFKTGELPNPAELSPKLTGALAEILCLRGNLAFHAMDLERTLEFSSQAIGLLTDESIHGLINPHVELLPVAYFNLAMAQEFRGDLKDASALFTTTLELSRSVENASLIAFSLGHLGGIKVIQGQLDCEIL